MAIWAPAKKDTLENLGSEILHNYGVGRAIIAVDGRSDSGARQFADDLAASLRTSGRKVFRASLDDFHRPLARWERTDPESADAYYAQAFDYSVLQRVLIDPFRASGSTSFVLAAYDVKRDAAIQPKWMSAGSDALLIVDGQFLNRPELAGKWNYSIWVETPADDGAGAGEADAAAETPADPVAELPSSPAAVAGADALYAAEIRPRGVATSIIDNRDPSHPRRVFADSC